MVGGRLSHGAVGSRETQMENSTRELWLSGTGDGEAVALSYLQPRRSPGQPSFWSSAVDTRYMQAHCKQSQHMQITLQLQHTHLYKNKYKILIQTTHCAKSRKAPEEDFFCRSDK